jgi:predicted regulator of Ras-like GTPase activity (Roadblock/LC7/MglB family)
MDSIADVLKSLISEMPEIIAAFVVSNEGFLIDSASEGELELESLAAAFLPSIERMKAVARQVESGTLGTLMAEYEHLYAILIALDDGNFFIVLSNTEIPIGSLRAKVRKAEKDIRKLL